MLYIHTIQSLSNQNRKNVGARLFTKLKLNYNNIFCLSPSKVELNFYVTHFSLKGKS